MATAALAAPGRGVPALPPQKGPCTVDAKEIEEVVLLRRRMGVARLDLGPFLAAYALTTAALLYNAIQGQWCGGGGARAPNACCCLWAPRRDEALPHRAAARE
jgi:hypothetical protein